MRILIIRSSEWARGPRNDYGLKVKNENKYCCLGLDGRDRGISDSELERGALPWGTVSDKFPREYVEDWDETYAAVNANDGSTLTDEERIQILSHLFRNLKNNPAEIDWRPNE